MLKKKSLHLTTLLFILCLLLNGCEVFRSENGAGNVAETGNLDNLMEEIANSDLENYPKPGGHPMAEPDSHTILVYLIGSNLESEYANATKDLYEMMAADIGDNVKVVVQTGGATEWHDNRIDPSELGRFELKSGTLEKVGALPHALMSSPETLTDFLRWGVEAYPAQHYGVILWNHGGGTIGGFGVDEFDRKERLQLDELRTVLQDTGAHFDFIGFDACLMGTLETAMMCYGYADYLVASEEFEPGYGWYYTNWLNALESNPKMETAEYCKLIVDDFVYGPNTRRWDFHNTLSVLDVKKAPALYKEIKYFYDDMQKVLNNDYGRVVRARANTKAFLSGTVEQIDLVDFVDRMDDGTMDMELLRTRVDDMIVYTQSRLPRTNGLAIYFPYNSPEYASSVFDVMGGLGFDKDYFGFYNNFLTKTVSGQMTTSRAAGPFVNRTYTSNYEWYDESVAVSDEEQSISLRGWTGDILATEEGIEIRFPEDETENIQSIRTNPMKAEYINLEEHPELLEELFPDGTEEMQFSYYVYHSDTRSGMDMMFHVIGNHLMVLASIGEDIQYRIDENGEKIAGFYNKWPSVQGIPVMYHLMEADTETEDWHVYGEVDGYVIDEFEFVAGNKDMYEPIRALFYWDELLCGPDGPVGFGAGPDADYVTEPEQKDERKDPAVRYQEVEKEGYYAACPGYYKLMTEKMDGMSDLFHSTMQLRQTLPFEEGQIVLLASAIDASTPYIAQGDDLGFSNTRHMFPIAWDEENQIVLRYAELDFQQEDYEVLFHVNDYNNTEFAMESAVLFGDEKMQESYVSQLRKKAEETNGIEYVIAAARQGDADAMYEYAYYLEMIPGGDIANIRQSVMWYERAGEAGHPDGAERAAELRDLYGF